jgi:hypothetical protein
MAANPPTTLEPGARAGSATARNRSGRLEAGSGDADLTMARQLERFRGPRR